MVRVSAQRVTIGEGGFLGLLFLLLAIPPGCYRPMMQRAVDARELYRVPAFTQQHMQREKVTALPARLSFGYETYGHSIVQGLVEAMQAHLPGGGLVHPNLMASHINEAGLAQDYAAMLTAYDGTNILDRDTLRRISEVVGVRYFAVPILVSFHEENRARFSVFGLRIGRTASANARFQLQIWDGRSGRIVWEGISDLTLAQEVIRERPVRFEDIVQATWESLIGEIPAEPPHR